MAFNNYPTDVGPASVVFSTHFEDQGFESAVPRELVVRVSGNAGGDIKAVAAAYANAANQFLPVLSFAANAAIDHLDIQVAFDNTPWKRRAAVHAVVQIRDRAGCHPVR
jgi:hypothetical protein